MVAEEVNMNRETVLLIPTEELGMRKICAQMVPKNLAEQQRDARLSAVFDIEMQCGDAAAFSSHDLAPCDLFLFQKVKSTLKGHHFE